MDNPFSDLIPTTEQGVSAAQVGAEQPANPFGDLIPREPTQDDSDSGAFMAGLENFNRSFGRLAEGGLQLGAKVVDYALGTKAEDTIKAYSAKMDASAQAASEQHPIAGVVGGITGDIARTIPAAVGTGGTSLVGQTVAGAATNAAYSGLEAAPDEQTRMEKIGKGAVAGAVGGLAGGLIGKGYRALTGGEGVGLLNKLNSAKQAATQSIAHEVEAAPGGLQGVIQSGEAAKKLGITLSPGQQIGTDSARALEGNIVLQSPTAKKEIMTAIEKNTNIAKGLLQQHIDDLVPKGEAATIKMKDSLFETLKSAKVDEPTLQTLKQNSIIKDYMADMSDATDITSIAGLNDVKKEISKAISGNIDSTQKLKYVQARNALTDILTNKSPVVDGVNVYGEANKLSQQLILKRDVMEQLGKMPKDASLGRMYQGLFGTQTKIDDFLDKVSTTGGDVQGVKDLIDVMGKLKITSLGKVAAREVGQGAPSFGGNNAGIVQSFMNNVAKGDYNDEMAKLLTENKWQPLVKDLLDKKADMGTFARSLQSVLKSVKANKLPSSVARAGALGTGQYAVGMLQQANQNNK